MEFQVISLTTGELNSIPTPERNFLITASFISNDIRFFWSMITRSPVTTGLTDLSSMQMVRWLWCTRKIAAAICEAETTLSSYCGKIPQLKALAKSTHPVLSYELRKSRCMAIARKLRNSVTSHYSTKELDESLTKSDQDAVHRIFGHKISGNSISELSERIYTLPKMHSDQLNLNLGEFNDWCRDASLSILRFCDVGGAQILNDALPGKGYETRGIAVGNEAAPFSQVWPLFVIPSTK
jgi:hypothetical protein